MFTNLEYTTTPAPPTTLGTPPKNKRIKRIKDSLGQYLYIQD